MKKSTLAVAALLSTLSAAPVMSAAYADEVTTPAATSTAPTCAGKECAGKTCAGKTCAGSTEAQSDSSN